VKAQRGREAVHKRVVLIPSNTAGVLRKGCPVLLTPQQVRLHASGGVEGGVLRLRTMEKRMLCFEKPNP